MADLHRAGREDEQPFGGEGLQDCLYIPGLGGAFALGQFRPDRAGSCIDTVAARGQPGEDLPGGGLLGGSEALICSLRAVGDGAFNAAGALVVREGEAVPGAGAPGLVKGVRQQGQHACA